MNTVIFGAQGYALGAYMAIKSLYPDRKVICFLVSSMGINAPALGGLPVRELDSFASELDSPGIQNTEVVIATPENVQQEIEESLLKYGFTNIQRLDSVSWAGLMADYYRKTEDFPAVSDLLPGKEKPKVQMYRACSIFDKKVQDTGNLAEGFLSVHAGAARDDSVIGDLRDDEGDNISQKNGNYSELTVLYWIWKNRSPEDYPVDYIGFMQYRRILGLSDDDYARMVSNNIDVVLPFPMPYEPNIDVHHKRYLKSEDWEALVAALNELQPEYAKYLPETLGQRYLYNYNIILAKPEVLSDYCKWLFPILERTEELSVPKGNERSDRYIGYMAETLETLYFMANPKKLKVAHAGCRMIC